MLHESLQADIVREYRLSRLLIAVLATSRVCGAWVKFRKQKARLRATGITDNVPG